MQNYMLERLLERISLSKYKNNFIIKGGFLVSAIVGLDTRATMDLDTTIKGVTLTHEAIISIFKEVCAIQIDDDVQFETVSVADIRETDDYPGIRVSLKASYPPISVPLAVDITTGDMITSREIEYTFSMLFDDRSINIFAYNLETLLAEKLDTVLSRNIANTRPRDYYDIYILYALRMAECDMNTLRLALKRTTKKEEVRKYYHSTTISCRQSWKVIHFASSGSSIAGNITMQAIFHLMIPVLRFKKSWMMCFRE